MNSKWMIRTRSNYLLGPISKEKLLELIENGSIHLDDEICSGNGYWFYLREKNLLDRYVYSETEQGFNPVSEALNEMRMRQSGATPKAKTKKHDFPNGDVSFEDTNQRVITQVIPIENIDKKGEVLEGIKSPEFNNDED